jgi:anaerobic selenocysteine-containing dehydrogenase
MCGLEIHVEGDRVTKIRPDDDDAWSKGYICPKGAVLDHVHHDDPDRLRTPLVRDASAPGGWREVGWPEAFARCEELLAGVIARHGKEAVTCYVGNPTAHNFSLARYVGLFIGLAQLPIIYSAGTVDQWPKNLACMLMYGSMWWIPTRHPPYTTGYSWAEPANARSLSRAPTCSVRFTHRTRRQDRRRRPAPHGNRRARG